MKIHATEVYCDKCFKRLWFTSTMNKFRFLRHNADRFEDIVLCDDCYKKLMDLLTFREFKNRGEQLETIREVNGRKSTVDR